jgi:DNA polymerase-1
LAIEVNKETTPAREILAKYKTKSMLDIPLDVVSKHCADDSRCTLALYHHYLPHINPTYFAVEMAVVPILIQMGLRGVKFSEPDRAEMETKLEADLAYYSNMIKSLGVDNPNSGQQVGFILAKRGNFLPLTKSRKQLKTDEDTLEFIDDPLAQIVLSHRQNSKLLTTYIRPLAGKDRIYTNYNLDARVGRISSSAMNVQNLPGKSPTRPRVVHYNVRNIIMPDSGMFTTGDYAQEHLYIIMHLSGDKQMEKVYIEGYMNGDIHSFTAQEIFGTVTPNTRKISKTLNYAIAYGATPKTISQQSKIQDVGKCKEFLDKWFKTFRDAAEWIKGAQREGIRDGWSLPTLFGRRIKLPEDEGEEGMKSKAINYPVQGSDGEIMKRALIICDRHKLPLAVTVHDSITLDGDCEFPVDELEHIAPVRIPFEVSKTIRWE